MLAKRYLTLSLLLSSTVAAFAIERSTLTARTNLVHLLQAPTSKLQICAKKGYPAYQNTLSAAYLTGREDLHRDKIKSLAWAVVVLRQIKPTQKFELIDKQRKYIRYLSENMSERQIRKAQYLARTYKKIYGQHWPQPPVLNLQTIKHSACILHKTNTMTLNTDPAYNIS